MRILMFNYEFPPIGGGGGWVSYFLGKQFVEAGHEVRLITSRFRDLPKEEMVEGFRVYRVPTLRKNRSTCAVHEMLTYAISSSVYGFKCVKSFHPEIIQVFFGIPSGGGAYLLQKVFGIPYIVFLGGRDIPRQNPDPPYYRLLYGLLAPVIKAIWGNAAAVVACSGGLRELALRTEPNIDINTIPDGLDVNRFSPIPRGAHSERVRILTVGRLIPRKDVQLLIRALPQLIQNATRDFEVEIVGDGPCRSNLVKLAEELRVSHKVRFAGSVPYSELPEKYQSADIFALCSLAEGMPLVVLEAMGSGLPVVASRVQGVEDVVKVGINGCLFNAGDVDALARQLASLIDDDESRRKMGIASVIQAQRYDWKNIAQSYLNIYKRVTCAS
ncbi:MAG: glycosyltransferase family 4 protein [Candidatus Poribacteria bacterium]|nr:glycosyltransferase family 4 protein [Candidatus Poribacteria bacterium]